MKRRWLLIGLQLPAACLSTTSVWLCTTNVWLGLDKPLAAHRYTVAQAASGATGEELSKLSEEANTADSSFLRQMAGGYTSKTETISNEKMIA